MCPANNEQLLPKLWCYCLLPGSDGGISAADSSRVLILGSRAHQHSHHSVFLAVKLWMHCPSWALSKLVWEFLSDTEICSPECIPISWSCSGKEMGSEAFWGPFQSEGCCDPILWLMHALPPCFSDADSNLRNRNYCARLYVILPFLWALL